MTLLMQATGRDSDPPRSRGLDQWVDHVLGLNYGRYCPGQPWAPGINLYEGDQEYCIVVDLAGVTAEQIDLHVENGVLVLSGTRETPGTPDLHGQMRVHLMEIDHGRFSRQIELPQDANVSDVEAVKACYRDGLLRVRIPKKT